LVVASPPCQEFSYRSFPFKQCQYLRDNVPPDKSIWEACVRIAHEAELPLVLENVRGAIRYMGPAQAHFGPYYLWGDVPVLLPDGRPSKGFYAKNDPGGLNAHRALHRASSGKRTSASRDSYLSPFKRPNDRFAPEKTRILGAGTKTWMERRREWSANAAKVPLELGFHIGTCFLPRSA
jgi:hypothetical protein